MKTKEEVLALLVALGTTAEEVANKLVSLGIKGNRERCRTCPIAQYLISNGVASWVVLADGAGGGVALGDVGGEVSYYRYPLSTYPLASVRDFILAFDRGEYPQCEKEIIQ
jgi:hypothetical protein